MTQGHAVAMENVLDHAGGLTVLAVDPAGGWRRKGRR
jgi:hypothetical protein